MEQSYKEKYEKALERIKNLIDKDHNDINVDDILNVFPELAESEDERIRKELIDAVQGLWDNDALPMPLSVKRKDEWIAWLEKQKEYESTDFEYVWDRTDCGELTSALDKYSEEAIINMCHAWYDKGIELERKSWLEKQGEKHQDPYNGISFEYNGHIWGMCARDNGVDISCDKHLIKHLEKQGEQKPAEWSEEDEQRLNSCLNILQPKTFVGNTETINTKWLKSLKDRVQPKQEWGEEDNLYYDDICEILMNLLHSERADINKTAVQKDINWLQSIKPQNRWKPSDEQIKVCKEVYADILSAKGFCIGTVNSELNRLEEELKKKGE